MEYKAVNSEDIQFISRIINDEERVFHGENINEDYSHDELGGAKRIPYIVVKVIST